MPNLVGLDQLAAYECLSTCGLCLEGVIEELSDSIPKGQVIRQDPRPGSHACVGMRVTLVISSGVRTSAWMEVSVEPSEAWQDGASWCLDHGRWMAPQENPIAVTEGTHIVSFKGIAGWREPQSSIVNVRGGGTHYVLGLYTPSLSTAFSAFADESVPPEEAADDLFDAFDAHRAREGYESAAYAMTTAIEEFVQGGGDLNYLTLRSLQIPSAFYDGWEVAERRAIRARLKSNTVGNQARSSEQGLLAGLTTYKGMREVVPESSDYDNCVIYVNGMAITYADFLVASGGLEERVRNMDTDYRIHCTGYWNEDGLLLVELGECTAQKIVEWLDLARDISVQNETTQKLEACIIDEVDAGKNVILVSHSQGNFHAREAVDNISPDKRAQINVLSVGSPVTFMPEGLRTCSRVDVEGDPVSELSLVNFDPFPFEGTWGWGDWLNVLTNRMTDGRIDVPKILLLNHHHFEGSYLQGEAGREIVKRIQDYLCLAAS
ncbi:MAG: PASTA domain-containing protein [Candidatus Hydrogenedentes bacterium]|nr:PASTA domain-containing protein [Candidatus Hydrogenedentota bacterium]